MVKKLLSENLIYEEDGANLAKQAFVSILINAYMGFRYDNDCMIKLYKVGKGADKGVISELDL